MFERPDYQRLADQLAALHGRFLLSLNDRPEVRAMFARFAIEMVEVPYAIGRPSGAGARFAEVLICGP